jgi:hypothetical protein
MELIGNSPDYQGPGSSFMLLLGADLSPCGLDIAKRLYPAQISFSEVLGRCYQGNPIIRVVFGPNISHLDQLETVT